LVLRLRGGGGGFPNFVDISKGNFVDLKFSKKAPDWRVCYNGLNIEGICKFKSCKANQQQVICPIYNAEVFDLILDREKVKCPKCHNNVEPMSCGFTSCSYSWAGTKINKEDNNNLVKYRLQKWESIGKEYRYFDPMKSGSCQWAQLKIFVKVDYGCEESKDEKKPATEIYCGFCSNLIEENCLIKLNCDHLYHKNCIENMKAVFPEVCVLCKF